MWSWGCNGNGTLGTGDKVLQTSPIKIPIDTKFKEIIASNYAYYAIDEQNCLWSWGTGFYGELGLDTITQQLSPKKVDDLLKFKSVEVLPSSNSSVFALDMEGNIWSWGYNDIGQLGLGNLTNKTVPNKIIIGVKFKSISTSFYSKSVAAIDENDHLWSWGKNDYGQLGLGNKINQKTPVCVDSIMMVKEVGLGSTHTAVLDMDGYLYTTGNGSVLGMGNTGTAELKLKKVSSTEKYKDILVDDTATYVININNDLYGFGQNSSNRFGNKSMSYYYVPTLIKSAVYQVFLTGYSKTSAFIIDLDGNLWAGGQNLSGQLGIGTNVNPDVFTPVSLVE